MLVEEGLLYTQQNRKRQLSVDPEMMEYSKQYKASLTAKGAWKCPHCVRPPHYIQRDRPRFAELRREHLSMHGKAENFSKLNVITAEQQHLMQKGAEDRRARRVAKWNELRPDWACKFSEQPVRQGRGANPSHWVYNCQICAREGICNDFAASVCPYNTHLCPSWFWKKKPELQKRSRISTFPNGSPKDPFLVRHREGTARAHVTLRSLWAEVCKSVNAEQLSVREKRADARRLLLG